jgi:hypothetical protein
MGQESKSPQVSALFRRARAVSTDAVDGSMTLFPPRSDRVRGAGGRRGPLPRAGAPSCLPGPRTAERGAKVHEPGSVTEQDSSRHRRRIVTHPSWTPSAAVGRGRRVPGAARSGQEARGAAFGPRGS